MLYDGIAYFEISFRVGKALWSSYMEPFSIMDNAVKPFCFKQVVKN